MHNDIENENQGFGGWIKKHKKGLMIGCGIVIVAFGGIIVFKNWDGIIDCVENLFSKEGDTIRISSPQMSSFEKGDVLSPSRNEYTPAVSSPNHGSSPFTINGGEPFDVSEHIRNLHAGQHASQGKIQSAAEYGISLSEGQTWVSSYTKNSVA